MFSTLVNKAGCTPPLAAVFVILNVSVPAPPSIESVASNVTWLPLMKSLLLEPRTESAVSAVSDLI